MKTISFPGLGIEPFTVDPTAFTVFGLEIRWYAIIIVTGMLLAALYVYLRTKPLGMLFDDLMDTALAVVFPAVICARIYYVIFKELEVPGTFQSFKDVINIRSGGLAIYGGIIGGALFALIVIRVKRFRMFAMLDALSPAVMIGQTIGRWGNFVNSEAYGSQTGLPWRMGVIENGEMIYVHPTFLYESLWNLLGLAIIALFYKKRRFDGQVFFFYFAWYGLGRMFIEGLRTDSLYIGSTGIRVSQLIAGVFFVVASFFFVFFYIRSKDSAPSSNIYRPDARHFEEAQKQLEHIAAERAQGHYTAAYRVSVLRKRIKSLFGGKEHSETGPDATDMNGVGDADKTDSDATDMNGVGDADETDSDATDMNGVGDADETGSDATDMNGGGDADETGPDATDINGGGDADETGPDATNADKTVSP